MSNSNITKKAIANSFKEQMENRPFNKISVTDITDGCGLNRQSFYYHFQDKYDLINWIFETEILIPVANDFSMDKWQEKLLEILNMLEKNHKFYTNAIKYANTEFRAYILEVVTEYYKAIVKDMQRSSNKTIAEEDELFISSFFAYGTAGVFGDWIMGGMKEKPEKLTNRLSNLAKECEKLCVEHYFGKLN